MYNFDQWKLPLKFGHIRLGEQDYVMTVETHNGDMIPVQVKYDNSAIYGREVHFISYSDPSQFDIYCKIFEVCYELQYYVDVTDFISKIDHLKPYKLGSPNGVNESNWKSLPITDRIRISVKQMRSGQADRDDWDGQYHKAILQGKYRGLTISGYLPIGLILLLFKIEVFDIEPNLILDSIAKLVRWTRTPKWRVVEVNVTPYKVRSVVQQLILRHEMSK